MPGTNRTPAQRLKKRAKKQRRSGRSRSEGWPLLIGLASTLIGAGAAAVTKKLRADRRRSRRRRH